MKRALALVALSIIGIQAVAQVPPATGGGQPAILMISRGDIASSAGCDIGLVIQGRLLGTLMPGQSASFNLPPGEVTVSLTSSGQGFCAAPMASATPQSINFAPGEIKQYRVVATESGFYLAPVPLYQ